MPVIVELGTRFGPIGMALDHEHAPKTAAHFESLVENGVFEDAFFYRIVHADVESSVGGIDVVQGGVGWDRASDSPTVAHESTVQTGLTHCHGAVSLGRSADADAGSEFFICIGEQSALDARGDGEGADGGFAVFAQVVSGMDVVEKIHNLPADGDPPGGDERFRGQFLSENVQIEGARLVRESGKSQ
mgnify:CR=1 FL=1